MDALRLVSQLVWIFIAVLNIREGETVDLCHCVVPDRKENIGSDV
jgi:hypothetical protein